MSDSDGVSGSRSLVRRICGFRMLDVFIKNCPYYSSLNNSFLCMNLGKCDYKGGEVGRDYQCTLYPSFFKSIARRKKGDKFQISL